MMYQKSREVPGRALKTHYLITQFWCPELHQAYLKINKRCMTLEGQKEVTSKVTILNQRKNSSD